MLVENNVLLQNQKVQLLVLRKILLLLPLDMVSEDTENHDSGISYLTSMPVSSDHMGLMESISMTMNSL